MSQRPGFPGARYRDDQRLSRRRCHRTELLLVEGRRVVDAGGGNGLRPLQFVFARHVVSGSVTLRRNVGVGSVVILARVDPFREAQELREFGFHDG